MHAPIWKGDTKIKIKTALKITLKTACAASLGNMELLKHNKTLLLIG